MPKLTDAQLTELINAGATDEEILQLSQESEAAPAESGGGIGGMLAGGALAAGAVGLGVALKKYGLGAVVDFASNARRQGMISGYALPKSLLGNLGAGVTTSMEEGSMAPLKEMLRLPTNAKNAYNAFKQGANYQGHPTPTGLVNKLIGIPGRLLGATDEAAQAALVRGGIAPEQAAKAMLQNEIYLGPQVSEALNTRLGQYMVPFRRTPINQGVGAIDTMSNWSGPGNVIANSAALGGGFATGAETEGVAPTVAGTAFFGRRGLPFAAASMAGKLAKGDSRREAAKVMQGASPVSDYSITESIADPLTGNPVRPPALWKLLFGSKDE